MIDDFQDEVNRWDWFAWIFITAIGFLAIGYAWRWGQEQ